MLKYVQTGLLAIVVATGVLLSIIRYVPFTRVAGGGFVFVPVLGHLAVVKRIEPGKDQPPGWSIQR